MRRIKAYSGRMIWKNLFAGLPVGSPCLTIFVDIINNGREMLRSENSTKRFNSTNVRRPATPTKSIEQMGLYETLIQMGNIYELNFSIDIVALLEQLKTFQDQWVQYNPYKPNINRQGLSITSLDGGLSGIPDLYSLSEYQQRTGKHP